VALAWGILLILTAVGSTGPFRPAQANTRIASTTSNTSSTTSSTTTQATLTSSVTHTLTTTTTSARAGRPEAAASAAIAHFAAGPRARAGAGARAGTRSYVVQPGDTLSGIASALGTRGGWPALYAANRDVIGPDPGLIRPGAVLALPGGAAAARYTVGAGDTLSAIAAALGTPGGWPALYAANRRTIGPDPDAIRAGTVLAIPYPAPSASHAARPASTPARAPASAQPPTATPPTALAPAPAPSGGLRQPRLAHRPAQAKPSAAAGLPRWLEIVLVAAGLLIATAFLTEPILTITRRRRAARPAATDAHIVLADYTRLVVTHSRQDGTVYVLRPPGADPHAILLAARLVLAQDRYEQLAGHLGVPAHWPRE
jgi:LysM repeat protein